MHRRTVYATEATQSADSEDMPSQAEHSFELDPQADVKSIPYLATRVKGAVEAILIL